MSLLEDVFLEDEAGEAQELERIIEGDDDERPHSVAPESDVNSDNDSEKEGEAAEDKRRVDPTQGKAKRAVKNPRFVLNPVRLTGPRGIQVIPDHFKDFKFKGKGHEKEDLDLVLKKLEHWAYRLYPKFQFEDCLKKIETLGKKRPVMVHLQKIRSDQFISEETVVQQDSSDEETAAPPQEEDEFDKLLQQQIELARATPAPGSSRKQGFDTPSVDKRMSLTMPKATSSPSINDEQRERMLRNRQLAEERRLARLKNATENSPSIDLSNLDTNIDTGKGVVTGRKHKQLNVIHSSDEENEVAINESINVDVHNNATSTTNKDIIDITEQTKHKVQSDVPDSEYDTGDSAPKDMVVDLTETGLNKNNANDVVDLVGTEEVLDDTEKNKYGAADRMNSVCVVDLVGIEQVQQIDRVVNTNVVVDLVDTNHYTEDFSKITSSKHNRSNVIDSSDEECEVTTVEHGVTVDVHHVNHKNLDTNNDETCKDKAKQHQQLCENDKDNMHVENLHSQDIEELQVNNGELDIRNNINNDMIEKLEINHMGCDKRTDDTLHLNTKPKEIIDRKSHSVEEESDICSDKENIDSNNSKNALNVDTEVDDLMDVDFSDDF